MMRALAVLTLLVLAAGCSGKTPEAADAERAVRNAASSLPVRTGKDVLLATEVKTKLVADDLDTATTVRVSAADGVVTLGGRVRTEAQRGKLETSARQVPGVVNVIDRLRVDPRTRGAAEGAGDFALAARVTAGLAAQSGLNAFKIRASAVDGVVTLDGRVSSEPIKATALETARTTSGVKRVVDRISIGS